MRSGEENADPSPLSSITGGGDSLGHPQPLSVPSPPPKRAGWLCERPSSPLLSLQSDAGPWHGNKARWQRAGTVLPPTRGTVTPGRRGQGTGQAAGDVPGAVTTWAAPWPCPWLRTPGQEGTKGLWGRGWVPPGLAAVEQVPGLGPGVVQLPGSPRLMGQGVSSLWTRCLGSDLGFLARWGGSWLLRGSQSCSGHSTQGCRVVLAQPYKPQGCVTFPLAGLLAGGCPRAVSPSTLPVLLAGGCRAPCSVAMLCAPWCASPQAHSPTTFPSVGLPQDCRQLW